MEGNIFYQRFQKRKSSDLEAMLKHESLYQPEALEASKRILDERKGQVPVTSPPIPVKKITNTPATYDEPLSLKKLFHTKFLKTLSRREFFSAIAIAILLTAVNDAINYYRDEDWLEDWGGYIQVIFDFSILPLIHIFYKLEHKRPNDFIGRSLHLVILTIFFILLGELRNLMVIGHFKIFNKNELPFYLFFPFGLLIIAIFIELPYTIVNYFFRIFKWRIW